MTPDTDPKLCKPPTLADTAWHAFSNGHSWHVCRRDEQGEHYMLKDGLTRKKAISMAGCANRARAVATADALAVNKDNSSELTGAAAMVDEWAASLTAPPSAAKE